VWTIWVSRWGEILAHLHWLLPLSHTDAICALLSVRTNHRLCLLTISAENRSFA
jgi:hypothetical protein